MIVVCQGCQRRYRVDPAIILGNEVELECQHCGNLIHIRKDQAAGEERMQNSTSEKSRVVQNREVSPPPSDGSADEIDQKPESQKKKQKSSSSSKIRIGLRAKMLTFFFFFPMIFILLTNSYFFVKLNELTAMTESESAKIVTEMAEDMVSDKALSVSMQARLYLTAHPQLEQEKFKDDSEFRQIAIQKIGRTGYTCIYSRPDASGKSSVWVHPNTALIGKNLPELMKKPLGDTYDQWWSIYKGAYSGTISKGYYTWQEADGSFKHKFMVCIPVENTPYIIASTAYVQEILLKSKTIKVKADKLSRKVKNNLIYAFAATIFLICLCVIFYSFTLSHKIRKLTQIANRISVGEIDADIDIKSRDEIGELSEAIGRLQDSIRLSIEKLRKKRG